MSATANFLLCVYIAAVFIQGYLAVSFMLAAWSTAAKSYEVASIVDVGPDGMPTVMTFDAIEPTAGQ